MSANNDKLETFTSWKPSQEEINDGIEIIKQANKFRQKHNYNLFDNYRFRYLLAYSFFRCLDSTIDFNYKRSGADFRNDRTLNGESKSGKIQRGKRNTSKFNYGGHFDFCKQDEEAQQDKVHRVGAFVFSINESITEEFVFGIYFNTEESVNLVKSLLLEKQREFVKEYQVLKASGLPMKRTAVQISLLELLNMDNKDIRYVSSNCKEVSRDYIINFLGWNDRINVNNTTHNFFGN